MNEALPTMRRFTVLAIAACLTLNAGCVSYLAHFTYDSGNPQPYRGTRCSIPMIVRNEDGLRHWNGFLYRICVGLDLPLTVALDTILLPIDLHKETTPDNAELKERQDNWDSSSSTTSK